MRSPKEGFGTSRRDSRGGQTTLDSTWEENPSSHRFKNFQGWGWGVSFFPLPDGTGNMGRRGACTRKTLLLQPFPSQYPVLHVHAHIVFLFSTFYPEKSPQNSHVLPFPGPIAKSPYISRGKFLEWDWIKPLPNLKPLQLLTVLREKYTSLKFPSRPVCSGPSDLSYHIIFPRSLVLQPQQPLLIPPICHRTFACAIPLPGIKCHLFKETFPQHTRPDWYSLLYSFTFQAFPT